jgi:hypothetical protein
MPVEIEELVIRMVVTPPTSARRGDADEAARGRDELVQQVVEQVVEILRQKEER